MLCPRNCRANRTGIHKLGLQLQVKVKNIINTSVAAITGPSLYIVSPYVKLVIWPAVGCDYFPPDPAAEHHCPLASTKLYCLVTEVRL